MLRFFHVGQNISDHVGRRFSIFLVAGAATLIIACGSSGTDTPPVAVGDGTSNSPAASAGDNSTQAATPTTVPQQVPTATPSDAPVATPASSDPGTGDSTAPEDEEDKVVEPTPEPAGPPGSEWNIEDDEERSRALRLKTIWGWDTNFTFRKIDLNSLTTVLQRDQIPSIDDPTFVSVSNAPSFMKPREPVIAVNVNGVAKAYPLAILMWHEIVNDTIGGLPVTITFCPLCNAGITFEREVEGQVLTFGTTGMLRHSDLVMWDRETETWWQQFTGEALVGKFAGTDAMLTFVPSTIIAWETFAEAYPDGKLLERVLNSLGQPVRRYDNPPYAGYDNVDNQPFLFSGKLDGRLVATSRVLTIDGETPVAYPFSFLSENPVVNDSVGDIDLVAFFDDGTLSAFGGVRNEENTSGSTTVFSRVVGDRTLTFELTDSGITDAETGSVWNLVGVAISGELKGTQLVPVLHASHFWFAWAVFKPDTEIRDSIDSLTL